MARGRAKNVSDFVEVALEQADNVGITMLEAVNDVGMPKLETPELTQTRP